MQNPTKATPFIFTKASGLNDFHSPVKMETGFSQFALNLNASKDVWNRREGRSFSFLGTGAVLNIGQLEWSDGTINQISQVGSTFYDLNTNFTYLFALGVRIIFQSSVGDYWDCTPDATTDLINPFTIQTPSATPQTADLSVAYSEKIGFKTSTGVVEMDWDDTHFGWYLKKHGAVADVATITTDIVFTYASGFHLIKYDAGGSVWVTQITDDGNLIV